MPTASSAKKGLVRSLMTMPTDVATRACAGWRRRDCRHSRARCDRRRGPAARVSALTSGLSCSTSETVDFDTPASRAMSRIVTPADGGRGISLLLWNVPHRDAVPSRLLLRRCRRLIWNVPIHSLHAVHRACQAGVPAGDDGRCRASTLPTASTAASRPTRDRDRRRPARMPAPAPSRASPTPPPMSSPIRCADARPLARGRRSTGTRPWRSAAISGGSASRSPRRWTPRSAAWASTGRPRTS